MQVDQPVKTPPVSNMLLTPSEPRLSVFPYPFGNRSDDGLSDHLMVANVRISVMRSTRLCMESAKSAISR